MQTANRTIGTAFLAALFLVMAIPAHAGVYKWVDESGTHYSDHPPSKVEVSQLRAQPESEITPTPSSQPKSTQQRLDEVNARLKAARELAAEQDKVRAEQRRRDDQAEAAQKAADNAVVDRCKRSREIYCDNGAENIRKEEEKRRAELERPVTFRGY